MSVGDVVVFEDVVVVVVGVWMTTKDRKEGTGWKWREVRTVRTRSMPYSRRGSPNSTHESRKDEKKMKKRGTLMMRSKPMEDC